MIKLHCAACGKELNWRRKAIPQKGIVMNLVEPHECDIELDIKSIPVFTSEEGEFKLVGTERGRLTSEKNIESEADHDHRLSPIREDSGHDSPTPIVEIDLQSAEEKVVGTLLRNGVKEKDILDAPVNKDAVDRVAEAFKQFPFVKKLNEGPDVEPLPAGDRRSKEHLRTEVQTSTAPTGLGDLAKGQVEAGLTTSEPGRELEEPDGREDSDE